MLPYVLISLAWMNGVRYIPPVGNIRLPEMIVVGGGEFLMGSPIADESSPEFHPEERPQERVRVDTFRLSKFLVTAEEVCRFLNETGTHYEPRAWSTIARQDGVYQPVSNLDRAPGGPLTWNQAQAYARWLSARTGRAFRLPSEAEWEYAARGPELRPWPWGDTDPLESDTRRGDPFYEAFGQRWYKLPRQYRPGPVDRAPVGSFPRNRSPAGIYDLLGYYGPQWCVDEAPRSPASSDRDRVCRILKGRAHRSANIGAVIRRQSRARQFLTLILEDVPSTHQGRAWSREQSPEDEHSGYIRLAEDAPNPRDPLSN